MLSPIDVEFDPSNNAFYITYVEYLQSGIWVIQPICYQSMGLAVAAYMRLIVGQFNSEDFDDHPGKLWCADLQSGLGATMVRFRTLLLMR